MICCVAAGPSRGLYGSSKSDTINWNKSELFCKKQTCESVLRLEWLLGDKGAAASPGWVKLRYAIGIEVTLGVS